MSNDMAAAADAVVESIRFNADGLVPAIAQQHDTGQVLMMAWMNADALRETMVTGCATYWSRSRQELWRKGMTSGQEQAVKDLRWDCDADTILLLVDQKGVACHTGRRSCFYNAPRQGKPAVIAGVDIDPNDLYG
jgi:phosphoribosyl-AMP cyclohydrolase